jgi:hypothetical protein
VKDYYDDKYEDRFEFSEALFLLLRGRYGMPAYDLSVNGSHVTSFATDFKGVWKNFVWLLNNDNYQIAKQSKKKPLSKDTLVLRTLQNETLRWIGNVPLEKVIEMRQRGELQEMRELLTRSICEIENVNDDEFFEVAREAEYRLQQAFRKHSNEVIELSNTFKRKYKIDLVSVFVTGSLGVVSAMYPPLAQSIGFLSSSVIESISVSKLVTHFLEERDSVKALKRRPVGMLFEAWKTKT